MGKLTYHDSIELTRPSKDTYKIRKANGDGSGRFMVISKHELAHLIELAQSILKAEDQPEA